jgi:hypothetical protein
MKMWVLWVLCTNPLNQFSSLAAPSRLRKITTDPQILADVNTECPDVRFAKLKIYIAELISNNYQYIPVAYVIMHCVIGL